MQLALADGYLEVYKVKLLPVHNIGQHLVKLSRVVPHHRTRYVPSIQHRLVDMSAVGIHFRIAATDASSRLPLAISLTRASVPLSPVHS